MKFRIIGSVVIIAVTAVLAIVFSGAESAPQSSGGSSLESDMFNFSK